MKLLRWFRQRWREALYPKPESVKEWSDRQW